MRATTKALLHHYVDHLDLSGEVLEIGGHRLASCLIEEFPEPRFRYHDLNLEASDIPSTIIADITGCADEIEDDRFDLVFSSDVFEHIDRPWLAAEEISRILKPGGIAVTHTLFSWRNHPCPIDYWRYSAECLEFLFSGLQTLEKGYDLSQRRNDQPGFWESGNDSVPVDGLGGWREHWSVWHVGRKGDGPDVPAFRESDHPQAHWLRMDSQGTVTNPKLLGSPAVVPADDAARELRALRQEVTALRRQVRHQGPVGAVRRVAGTARRAARRVGI
ncbi:class I SAM-dependent methyltransferase [Aeromicrobium sp. CF4.19]|uniref:class I SAM-dependent methyltransferase n=1 Tax=Aeromicrobium sp. CF4.19 TaxID=3373082 RepID=UPI003EE5CD2F